MAYDARRTEQVAILYRNLPISISGTLAMALALSGMLYPDVATTPLLIWLVVVLGMSISRSFAYWRFRNAEHSLNGFSAARLGRNTMIYSACYGLLWAWLPFAYFDPNDFVTLSNIALFLYSS